ncbi:pentapeptide repeat-containing protein [Moorena sp. SIO3H5]|uniref:pentapeptide repeat-containing protein n=1 Tax=Moorena sp. SIO3H5 TaxID=2607834 RepID=UPI0013BA23E8|nr:pentapeptide repeat-containing protein [Moorena sp. SIO3H5]NEO72772.1 pentapeptide repeat-containing protein [Moorena sp. SIO3H5]
MEANEVLKRYAAGERDFRRVNLRGQSFQGKNLSEADFSEADIRGTNFKNATLTGTKFCKAKAGLQKRWVIVLLLVSWVISGLSGILSSFSGSLVALMFESSDVISQVSGWIALVVIIVLFAVILHQGIGVATAIAGAIAVPFTVAGAFAIAFAIAVAGAFTIAIAVAVAGAIAGAIAIAVVIAIAVAFAIQGASVAPFAGALAVSVAFILFSTYLGWRALKGDPRDAWIRSIAIVFAATRGTSFHKADLTDADFTGAILKSTDLREATLTRTCWQNTIKLDQARPGTSYLQYENIRQLLLTGEGQDKNFYRLDLRGINLKGANLQDASFIATDLNRANLQNTNLSRAKLVQTLLEGADLTRATLTGAYIEDWAISNTTKLVEIKCDYIFLKLPTKNSPDPKRRPADQERNFQPGEFAKLAQKIPNTVDLIFKDGIDWQTLLKTFQELRVRVESETGELPVIQTIENKGDGAFVIRVKVPEEVDEAEYERKFWAKYNPMLEAKDEKIKLYSEQIEFIRKDNTKLIGIIETMAEKETTKYDQRGANINIGSYVDTAQSGSRQQGYANQNNYEEGDKNLAEAAEIQQLLEQLEKTNPTATEAEQEAFVSAAITPTKKERLINALKEGGQGAIEEFLDNPYLNVAIRIIEGWRNP